MFERWNRVGLCTQTLEPGDLGLKTWLQLWRTVRRFLKNLKIELPYNTAIPLLGIYPEKTIIQTESCTTMFTAALFAIARTWK